MNARDVPLVPHRDAGLPWWRRYERIEGRTLAFLVVLLVHLLLGFMLFTLAPKLSHKPVETAMELRNFAEPRPESAAAPAAKSAVKQPKPPTPQHPQIRPPMPPQPLTFGPQVDPAFDIAKLPNHRAEMAQAENESTSDSAATYGPGQGPGGAPLFNAEWYREPTNAELAGYLPSRLPPNSWGMIACRTIEQNRVEDCEIMDESPRGSGMGRAVQAAAWQFRVRPPRKGRTPMIGTWVRITIHVNDSGDMVF